MKFAVFALISMYVIVQSCGKIVLSGPSLYFHAALNRRNMLPQASSYTSAHYYNNKNAYKHKHNYMHTITTSDGRRMIVPLTVPIVPVPFGGLSTSYSAGAHSSSAAASHQHNHHSLSYHSAMAARRNDEDDVVAEEPVVVEEESPASPTCENKVEEEEVVEVENNSDKYRKEMCHYISPKIESLMQEMSLEDLSIFLKDFVAVVDNYCDFANLD